MAAQHGYLLTNAPLSAAIVPQRMCMQEGQVGAHEWSHCCQALAQRSTGSRVASLANLPTPGWR